MRACAYLQNNVLELWSLFDFLMPGFLGTEKQFYERYGKPIIQSRDAKSSSKEQEAGLDMLIARSLSGCMAMVTVCKRLANRMPGCATGYLIV